MLDQVSKHYGGSHVAVSGLSLEVGDGEVSVLVGPSGCGKTTTLRMINRLIEPSGGRILLDGRDVLGMDAVALRRGIGYVIQQGGLFPHRRVADNVAVVPRLLGWDKARVAARVDELLELVGLDPDRYGRRFPHELSGGERQRVGVARALGGDPPVLLMDEPFGAVDPVTRLRLQQQLLELQRTLRKTIVFVTHDIEEAAKLGDRIAVLSPGGVLEQYDTPAEVLGHPATPFVGEFVGDDRGVQRLAVTAVSADDLFHPPTVTPSTTLGDARRIAAEVAERWAVVVTPGGTLLGWVATTPAAVAAIAAGTVGNVGNGSGAAGDPAKGDGAVAMAPDEELAGDHVVPFDVGVPIGTSLRAALGEMLQHDVRWLPVLEDGRYLGVLTPNRLHAAMRRSVGGNPVDA